MKKLFLTLTLLTSVISLDAASKDDHPCKQLAEGASGSTWGKMNAEVVLIFASLLKLSVPEKLIYTILIPAIHDLTEVEVNQLRNQALSLNISQQKALKVASTLNNGFYTIGTMLGIVGAAYAYYGQAGMAVEENIQKMLRLMVTTYSVSQLSAILIAYLAKSKTPVNNSQETTITYPVVIN